MSPSVPFRDVTGRPAELLEQRGVEVSDLYRALANNEPLLELWLEMAWGMRARARTPRPLRELMILRSAYVQEAAYQWADHVTMATEAGVTQSQIDAIADWRNSDLFNKKDLAALTLTDEMLDGHVTDETLQLLEESFPPDERVELIVTAGFYCMVPRVLDALRLPVNRDC